jgi:SAM-dependent methyltransferase
VHQSALEIGTKFFETYWRPEFRRVLDIGGADLNGSLRHVCPADAEFLGIDLEPAPGVDLVLDDPYVYPFPDGHFDCVISTSCFEHDRMFWLTFLECSRVLSPNGILYINAPSGGPYHGYPHDYWRFYADAPIALTEWSVRMRRPIRRLESFIASEGPFQWNDCVMIFTRDSSFVPEVFLADKVGIASSIYRAPRTT